MNLREIDLEALQTRDLPRLDWRTMFKYDAANLPAEDVAAMDAYFRQFVAVPDFDKMACVSCGADLLGFLGTFQWGLAHGEGQCSRCKYPARALHFDVGPIKTLTIALQYHPSELTQVART